MTQIDWSDGSDGSGGKDSNCIAGCLGRRRACHGVGLGDISDSVGVSTLRKTRGIPLKKMQKMVTLPIDSINFYIILTIVYSDVFWTWLPHGYHMVPMVESLIELPWIASDGDPNVSSMLLAFATETNGE